MIGIAEISYRKGQKYMTVVVDHETAKVVWMTDGHGKDVLDRFFDDFGKQRTARLRHISAALTTGMSNGLIESANTKTRLIIRRGFGSHSADAVILNGSGPPGSRVGFNTPRAAPEALSSCTHPAKTTDPSPMFDQNRPHDR